MHASIEHIENGERNLSIYVINVIMQCKLINARCAVQKANEYTHKLRIVKIKVIDTMQTEAM